MLQLHMICTHVFERLYQIGKRDQRAGEDLTQREIDCLNWTAAGKTSVEISDILSLSEHTINHYLNRATKKLDTVNRTQAVAKALRMGIIA
jgi:DNA-binding CsgD family transcriptional regulator